MQTLLADHIRQIPIVDVHEHHIPEIMGNQDLGLLQLLNQSYAGWTIARPYALPSESRDSDPMLNATDKGTWEDIKAFVEDRGTNSFVRNMIRAITGLYDCPGDAITKTNWEDIDEQIRQKHRDASWFQSVIEKAGIDYIITDPYTNPLLDAKVALGQIYTSVMRINSFAFGWHKDSRDHNGNSAHELLKGIGLEPTNLEEYLEALERLVETLPDRNQVALKNALAYDRDLEFDEPNPELARQAWAKENPDPLERKAFSDLVVDHLCRLAGERDIPVQMHLGTAILRGSHPMNVAGLIERHPKTRFLLMHLAYPWSRDLLGMAFVYRNIWLDLTWSLLLSPSHFKLGLHEALEILPDESRLMLGGDNWHVEETFATFELARRLIGEVLEEKVTADYFKAGDAERLAKKIFRENAQAFFGL